jgi:hypothetical protein
MARVPHSKASRAQCDNPTRILTVGGLPMTMWKWVLYLDTLREIASASRIPPVAGEFLDSAPGRRPHSPELLWQIKGRAGTSSQRKGCGVAEEKSTMLLTGRTQVFIVLIILGAVMYFLL